MLILTVPLRMFMTGRLFSVLEMKCVSTYSKCISLIHPTAHAYIIVLFDIIVSLLQLDADDAKVNLEEEPGEDVYNECPLP